MEAFGITISSRYGRFDELIELLLFAQAAAEAAVAHYVKEAFYDSQSCTCSFELDRTVILGSEIEMTLRSCAHNTVSQFVWFDQCCGVAIEEDG
ncbi:hypothetical protein ASC98_17735 [Rhizobacter sp. Root1238]|nr:hypothetical protein ASC88_17605 [Rhizobacter sp. Root29]KQW13932.1 hypothetical protein ASC98_17735 [Rhizobacter sp. Root1238]